MAISGTYGRSPEGMLAEAHRIIDAARSRGPTLRLVGGLAVREHCRQDAFCERPYRDIDLAGLGREVKASSALLVGLGWQENRQVAMATAGGKRQFFRECRHGSHAERAHDDDRIDLYVDAFQLHHAIDLRRRLRLEPYTVSTSDVLLVKLQRTTLNDDDLRDVVTVIKDAAELGERDAPGALNLGYLSQLCAADWGLHHDVVRNLTRCRQALGTLRLDHGEAARLRRRLDRLETAVEAAPKTLRWRLRALPGERLAWHEPVDDIEGTYLTAAERP